MERRRDKKSRLFKLLKFSIVLKTFYNNRKHTTTKHNPQRIIESRWDEELRKEVYKNIKASRKAKSEDYKEGEIVRITNYLKLFILYQIEPLIYKINKIIIKLNNSSPCRVEPAAIAENAQHDPHDNSRCWSSQ